MTMALAGIAKQRPVVESLGMMERRDSDRSGRGFRVSYNAKPGEGPRAKYWRPRA